MYCVTKILTICNIFLFKFTASSLYCLWEPAENLMVRHLTSPYFLESCGSEMLLWRCYTTKVILAERNIETFNTFIGSAISFKHMLSTCFKVISQNCKKGFTIFLCNFWSLLYFCHIFLILLSWLRIHVQSQQQKNKVRFRSSLRGGVVRGSVGPSSFE